MRQGVQVDRAGAVDRRGGGVLRSGGQADRCAGERCGVLAARQGRVHRGTEGDCSSSRRRTRSRRSSSTNARPASPRPTSKRSRDTWRSSAQLEDVDREVIGPIPSEDGKALQVLVPINAGSGGWETIGERADDIRRVAADRPDGLSFHVTGPGGFAADSQEAFAGIDGKLLYSAAVVVIVILLLTYRSPVLWLLPLISAGVALFAAQAVIYLPGDRGGPDRQRAERRHPHSPGVRCWDGLCPAAGGPLSRGAAAARGPARGDGVRAAPVRSGHHRLWLHRGGRHALPAVRVDELDPRPRSGRSGRHRRRTGRHADPAARSAGHLRPLGVLAAAADVRLRRPHRDERVGSHRAADRRPAAADLGHHHPGAGRRLARHAAARRRTA